MEEEKKKRKNKKKKNKQTKGTENNAVSAEESTSSNQNHPAKIHGSEAHSDDTSGIDDDPKRHNTGVAKVSSLAENEKHCRMDTEATSEEKSKQSQKDKVAHMQKEICLDVQSNFDERIKQLQNENTNHLHKEASFEEKVVQLQKEISSLRRQEANQEEKIRQLHMEKDVYLQKEAEFEMKNSQLQSEKNSWLLKEVSLEKKIKEMEKETERRVQKEASLEERISLLVGELENLNSVRVSLEEKVKEMEKERENWVQKENTPENGDLNSEVVATQALVDKLIDENAELVEKVKNLYVELERRGPPMEVSSFLGSDIIITTISEEARIADESGLGSQKMPGAVQEHEVNHATEPKSERREAVLQSGERLQSLKDTIDKAIPLDENEVQSADLEPTNVDQEEVPLSNAPLIGAPFRLISFFARYVSGADLVNKNAATSNQ